MDQLLQRLHNLIEREKSDKGRALVTWIDTDGEWSKEALAEAMNGICEVLFLEEKNIFQLKRQVERQKLSTSFLLYSPSLLSAKESDALSSLLGMSVTFHTDNVMEFAQELKVDEMKLRQLIAIYPKFFKATKRKNRLEKLMNQYNEPLSVKLLIASILNCEPSPLSFIKSLLSKHDLVFPRELLSLDLDEALLQELEQYLKHDFQKDQELLPQLIDIVIASVVLRDSVFPFQVLQSYQTARTNQLAALYEELLQKEEIRNQWTEWTDEWGRKTEIDKQLAKLSRIDLGTYQSFKKADDLLIERILEDSSDDESIVTWLPFIEARQLTTSAQLFDDIRERYALLHTYVSLIQEYRRCLPTIKIEPENLTDLYQTYIDQEYRIDQLHRQLNFMATKQGFEPFEQLLELERFRYEHEFLQYRTEQATHLLNGPAPSLTNQLDFYQRYVHLPRLQSKAKQYVIISDALRYEAGVELAARLEEKFGMAVSTEAMVASAPTYTQLGMASLLPQQGELTFNQKVIEIDGYSTQGLINREKILNRVAPSKAFKVNDFVTMKVSERREAVRGFEVVYLYHNVIDASGDKMETERLAFSATNQALEELERLVKSLQAMEAKRIVITADHGYLYVDEVAEVYTKVVAEREMAVEGNTRFLIYDPYVSPGIEFGAIELPSTHSPLNNKCLVATGLNRFRKGSGSRFMHGSVSAQERIVPVVIIEAQQAIRAVEVRVQQSLQLITTMTPRFVLYQTEAVSSDMRGRPIRLSLEWQGRRISNQIRFDFQATERRLFEQIAELKLFEATYPAYTDVELILETLTDAGWTRYQTYSYAMNVQGRNES
ncbi:BREX-1 system phosphatase PglZ type A [Planomicrobium chinense]|uniref:BREX-1 system phosphatase PglZ type A n=1 Tax=Planococcus chinensis TaxID=272917 RepID=UPI001CC71568|nr:BREX-1 system phosphatase PglZ type A [Planococcus chinensis]MBZ5201995.1 BREX-1 system phosphatase PglZ type A [Planococcus chinensis]